MIINFNTLAPVLHGMSGKDDFDIKIVERPTGTPSSQTIETLRDYTRSRVELVGAINTFNVNAVNRDLSNGPVNLHSLYPYICTINDLGEVSKGSVDGPCTIEASSIYGVRRITRDILTVGNRLTYTFVDYTAGSLARHVRDLIDGYYSGKAANDANLKISLNDYTSNPTRVAQEIDMSWQSVNASDGSTFPCSLITPRHALCAAHAGFFVGRQYVFRTKSGNLIYPTTIATTHLGNDLALLYFDQPVSDCAIAKIAPDIAAKTSLGGTQAAYAYGFPAIITLQNWYSVPSVSGGRKMMLCAVGGYNPGSLGVGAPVEQRFQQYYPMTTASGGDPDASVRPGDSGSCVFFPVVEPGRSEPTCVLLTALQSATSGPNYSHNVSEINTALNTLAGTAQGTYAVQQADLSAFSSF